jgi:hypothetical protein
MFKRLTATLLLIGPNLSSASPPSPDSPLYVPPPPFVDPDTDDPRSANHLLQGIWDTSSSTDHFAFEIKLLKFRVMRSHCDWLHWEWVSGTDELINGKLVLTKGTIRVVGEPGATTCLGVPILINIDFSSPPKYDVAKVALDAGSSGEQILIMKRHPTDTPQ